MKVNKNLYTIDIDIKEKNLVGRVFGGQGDQEQYLFYVLRYSKVFFKQPAWTSSTTFEFQLPESGVYALQCHIKRPDGRKTILSSTVTYLDSEFKSRYQDFLLESPTSIPNLQKTEAEYPYANLAILVSPKHIPLVSPSSLVRLEVDHTDKNIAIASSTQSASLKDIDVFLSGSFIINDKLIHGSYDLNSVETPPDGCIGNYTAITLDRNNRTITFAADYFGISKIFYFENDEILVATNNYRLLLEVLAANNIAPEFDKDRVAANFVMINLQPFHQLFSEQMDVANVRMLPIDKKLTIADGFWTTSFSEISSAFCELSTLTDEEYQHLLHQAAKEIINNTGAALQHEAFTNVIIDLSGGMDSRIVYAAATHFPEFHEKIRIHSRYSKSEPKDLDVALSLSKIYAFKFDDIKGKKSACYGPNPWSNAYSHNLGVYYSYTPHAIETRLEKCVRLVGFYGEICARPYYARSHFKTELDTPSTHEFVTRYFEKYGHFSFVSSKNGELDRLARYFEYQLERTPGSSALEKFDNHYLFFRNGLHCSDAGRIKVSCPEFGPIMSKTLFKLKRHTFHQHKSIKLQLDLLNILNPIIAAHEYQSDKDNQDKQSIAKSQGLVWSNNSLKNALIPTNADRSDWEIAEKTKESTFESVTDPDAHNKFSDFYRNQINERNKQSFSALNILANKGIIDADTAALDIWLYLTLHKETPGVSSSFWNLCNRISSIFHQYSILNADSAQASSIAVNRRHSGIAA